MVRSRLFPYLAALLAMAGVLAAVWMTDQAEQWTSVQPSLWWLRGGGGLLALVVAVLAWLLARDPVRLREVAEAATSELRASESRIRAVVDNVPDGILIYDQRGTVESFNNAAERIFGYAAAEVIGQNITVLFSKSDGAALQACISDCLCTGNTEALCLACEMVGRRKDGSAFPIELATSEVRLGEEQRFIAIARDITERRRADEALRETNQTLQAIIQAAPLAIFALDADGHVKTWNPAAERIFGWSEEEVRGRLLPIVPEDKQDEFRALRQVTLRGGTVSGVERRRRRKDNSSVDVSIWAAPLRDAKGDITAIMAVLDDITARKRAQEAQEHLTAILEATTDFVGIADVQGRALYINRAGRNTLGIPENEDLSGTPISTYHARWANKVILKEGIPTAMREGTWRGETAFLSRDGREMPVSQVILAHRAPDGTVTHLSTVARDVTERRQAEEALRQANEELTARVSELEQRSREITLLSEMADLLQACHTAEEAYGVIAQSTRQLFPTESGALYVHSASKNLLEAVAIWGKFPPDEVAFAPEDCWALRRGRTHRVDGSGEGLACRHLGQPPTTPHLCVPMMALGETLGVLHVQASGHEPSEPGRRGEDLTTSKQRLVVTVAEHIALALANLKLQETLRSQAIRDPLTSLLNRRYMEEALAREVHRAVRRSSSLGIVMLDIDQFKSFNDTFGHAAGDALLRELGAFLHTRIRGEDIACRYGGEEFTLILPDASLDDTERRADQLREEIKHLEVWHQGRPLRAITMSMGVAALPDHGTTGDVLLQAADAALFRAKNDGRDRLRVAE